MLTWQDNKEYFCAEFGKFEYKKKKACFDLDGTLIKPKDSGKKFSVEENDWVLFSSKIPEKLNELHKNDYCIIIITNQAILKNNSLITKWKNKIKNIAEKIKIPFKLFCSTKFNIYRKPMPSFMDIILDESKLENYESFYCGDAAGRLYDHSDCDYKFAINCKISFITPETFFDNMKTDIKPIKYIDLSKNKKNNFDTAHLEINPNENKQMIILVGPPGSGKSTYARSILENFSRINQDELKTKTKCLNQTKKYLLENKNIVIDNTNPSVEARNNYISLAKKYNYYIYCFLFDIPQELAYHNSLYRAYKNKTACIQKIVYRIYYSKYKKPKLDEGFKKIITINNNITTNDKQYYLYFY